MSEVTNRKNGRQRGRNEGETADKGKSKLETIGGESNEMRAGVNIKKKTSKVKQDMMGEEGEEEFGAEDEEIISGDEEGTSDPYKKLLREKLASEGGFWSECCSECFWQFVSVFCIFSGASSALCFEPCYRLIQELYYELFN